MKSTTPGFMGIAVLMIIAAPVLSGQNAAPFGENEKIGIIQKAVGLLSEHYIFPERVNGLESAILQKAKNGGYAGLTQPQEFLQALNADLEREGKDHHLNIFYSPERVRQIRRQEQGERDGKADVFTEEWLRRMRYENFRMRKLERLDGNVGYFQFLNFPPLAPAEETLRGALSFLRFSSAIIVDLRENGGGNAETVHFLLGFFLKDGSPIGEWRYRKDNRIEKTFVPSDSTLRKIPDDVPVYILVSNRTSSAAEGFAYTLQQYKRAIVVGEQTKGEGNPGRLFALDDALYMMIPTIESRNALSGKSIDGTGVTPDIPIAPEKGLTRALLEIFGQWSQNAANPDQKQLAAWQIPLLENELNPAVLPENIARSIVGEYSSGRKFVYEGQTVFYVNRKGKKIRMDYLGNGVFQHSDDRWVRLRLPSTDSQPLPWVEWIWDDGGTEKMERTQK